MQYQSQLELIWAKLVASKSSRRPTHSRETFNNVCDTFFQAEFCPFSDESTTSMKLYAAEANIWAYYFGGLGTFPGVDPIIIKVKPENANSNPTKDHNHRSFLPQAGPASTIKKIKKEEEAI